MNATQQPKVENYTLVTRSGRLIRTATKATFADGHVVKFMERVGKGEAIRQALAFRSR